MIASEDLNKCIENLSILIGKEQNSEKKTLLLEIGFILKAEYDLVRIKERQGKIDTQNGKFDIKLLLKDNQQLFNENQSLVEQNKALKKIVDENIPFIKQAYTHLKSLIP